MVTRTTASSPWDDVEHAILAAAREPVTLRQIADRTGLTPDLTKTQVEALRDAGILVQAVNGGVRYRLTLAGHKRLFTLADTTTDRPGNQAAA